MDYIKLVDGYELTIEDGASIAEITHIAEDETAATEACAEIKKENVKRIEFWDENGTAPYGVYGNMVLLAPATRQDEEVGGEPTGRVIVRFGLREQNEIEARLEALEVSQAIQDGAIEDIAEVVSELAEGGEE